MKFESALQRVGHLPLVNTELLLAGTLKPEAIKVQISRWQKAGKLVQLRRGLYLLSESYRKVELYEPYLASVLKSPSYLSLEKALEHHDLIPEGVAVYTSVTTKRPGKYVTPVGTFDYRHLQPALFWGYHSVKVNRQTAFIASPEKALLDFFYLRTGVLSWDFLCELRLQNMEKVSMTKLHRYARRYKKTAMRRAAHLIQKYRTTQLGKETEL